MILKRFYDEGLAQASYMIGCAETSQALVVDPNRDIQQYIDAASAEHVRITQVTETHLHADFVSGTRELSKRAGAVMLLSDAGDANWKYTFANGDGATLLRDGDSFSVGNISVEALHTPGHTPEHLAFLITDTQKAAAPMGACTGDFVFVGDVGRPDLLERAVGQKGTMESAARQLYASIQKFRIWPDHLQIWPGHGAGSACGKALSAVPQSTLGYEKLANWAFGVADEKEFVQMVLAGQPEAPAYFAHMKKINKEGPASIGGFRKPDLMDGSKLSSVLDAGGIVIDTRSAIDFAAGHVPGTINIPLSKKFSTYAGSVVPYDRNLYLLVGSTAVEPVYHAARALSMIGFDRLAGWFRPDALDAWRGSGRNLDVVPQMDAAEIARRRKRGDVTVVDVRARDEWRDGHIEGAVHIPLGQLEARLEEVPRERPVVVHCQGGTRSAIAASVLRARGVRDVINLAGGFSGWQGDGQPVVREPDDGNT